METKINIADFYAEKSVLVTGGSGFIGKVLIEKLLRSCPKIKAVYVLLRQKKGKNIIERLNQITDNCLFDPLKQKNSEVFKKLIPLEGDVSSLSLGLKDCDEKICIENVNIIFHCAASVRFHEKLKNAIILNTRGTREIVNLAKKLKNLSVLVHVSTTYAHIEKVIAYEEVTPTKFDWREVVDLAENYDDYLLDVFSEKYREYYPNTYTFTKKLAEHVVQDLCNNKIPAVICRPSMIVSTNSEPLEGWVDNFNGPMGLMLGSVTGLLRTKYLDENVKGDYLPVDLLVKMMIAVAWDKGLQRPEEKLTLNVYNCCNNSIKDVSIKEMEEYAKIHLEEVPFQRMLWYPSINQHYNNYYIFIIKTIFYHVLPAFIMDFFLKLTNRKPFWLNLYRRIYNGNLAVYYFLSNEWKFINEKTLQIEKKMSESDLKDFAYDVNRSMTDPRDLVRIGMSGAKKYLFKETATLEQCKRNYFRLWILKTTFDVVYYLGLFWLLFYKFDVVGILLKKFN